jgi:peroxin-7
MSVKLWDWRAPENALLASWDHHTEFAVGLDWSLLQEGLLASSGWDEKVAVWHREAGP